MNLLDKVIGYIAPAAAQRRLQARASLQQIAKLTGTSAHGPYDAAKVSRLNKFKRALLKENEVTEDALARLQVDSWDLYRNNPSARKILRSLESKVIGKKGMQPESLAKNADGTPHVEFRKRAKELWESLCCGFDARGMPGRGGLSMGGLQKLSLRATVLSGQSFFRLRSITPEKQSKHDLPVPIALQLIDTCRLASDTDIAADMLTEGHNVFRGIELNADGERVAYWIRNLPLFAGASARGTAVRVDVEKMGHLYIEEDIDQLTGTPWFASAILRAQRTDDLEYNTLMASAMAACVVATYSKPTGAQRLGLNQSTEASSTSSDGTDLTDTDGNTIDKIQPGLIVNKGKDGSFDLMSPNQPNLNPEAFVQHLQRGTASAIPGIKSSTVTGDYRNSSFSSERSADNDTWPEVQDVQEWFASGFCQPIWETVLRSAVLEGWFAGIVSPAEFQASPGRFSDANWQGPVALSIDPGKDIKAASDRIKGGVSSVQMECAKVGTDWRDVLNDVAELYEVAASKNIPPEVVNNIMGVDSFDQLKVAEAVQPVETETEQETASVAT